MERPQRSEDERRGHRQAVEDDQQRRKSTPLTDSLTQTGRLVEGATVQGWKAALGALALAYPDRLAGYLT